MIVPSRVISGWIHILPSNISARRIVGSAIGIIIAWGTAIVVLAFWAQTTAMTHRGDAAWALGVGVLRGGFLPAFVIATVVGGALGWWRLGRSRERPWTGRPPGTIWRHYPVALFAAVVIALFWGAFLLLLNAAVLEILGIFIGMLNPDAFRWTARFMLLFELTAMVTMGRLALNGLDRAIHRFRTVQTA